MFMQAYATYLQDRVVVFQPDQCMSYTLQSGETSLSWLCSDHILAHRSLTNLNLRSQMNDGDGRMPGSGWGINRTQKSQHPKQIMQYSASHMQVVSTYKPKVHLIFIATLQFNDLRQAGLVEPPQSSFGIRRADSVRNIQTRTFLAAFVWRGGGNYEISGPLVAPSGLGCYSSNQLHLRSTCQN